MWKRPSSIVLSTVLDYKTKQTYNGVNWESTKTKYVEINESFVGQYPTRALDVESFPKNEPEKEFTKERILSKIKILRVKYRAALDSGGRLVVAAFYDICSSTWEGSPSAGSVDEGVESCNVRIEGLAGKDQGGIHESGAVQSSLENATGDDVTSGDDEVNEDICASSTSQPKETKAKADGRRDLITFTKDQRNGKLRKIFHQIRSLA